MTKKVVHIIIGLNIGGAELMLKRLVLNSHRKGLFQHEVISLMDMGPIGIDLEEQGITVHALNMSSIISSPIVSLRLYRLLKKIKPDVVQTWMYHSDLIGGLAAKKLGIKKIIWGIRNSNIDSNSGIDKKVVRYTCAKVSNFIPSSIVCVAHKAKEVHSKVGYNDNKMLVIPNGFDLSVFYPDKQKREAMRTQLNLSIDELVIGHMGRFTPAKNHANFIRACLKLFHNGYTFKVVLGGRGVDLNNPEIAALLKGSSHTAKFIFLGQVKDMATFYNAIDVFCLTSVTEGFPNVLGEAMATQKICLSTDAGDAKIILKDNGFHIPSTDYRDIANILEQHILKTDKVKLEDMAKNARQSIETNYTLDKIVNDFETLYR